MVATWFHYRYWADALADTVGYPISLFVTPAFFALAALALTWVMMSYRPTFRRCWLGFNSGFCTQLFASYDLVYCWRVISHQRSNQSMKPTAGRCEVPRLIL